MRHESSPPTAARGVGRIGVAIMVLSASCVQLQVPPAPAPLRDDLPAALPLPDWQVVGESVKGRPIRYRKLGSGYRHVLWIGGIHGNETEGVVATDELAAAFASDASLHKIVTLHIVEDMNPDGRAAGTRGNHRGVDLNRDFPATNRRQGRALSQPESRAVHDLILRIEPAVIIVAHSWSNRYFINFDGPARHLAQLFAKHSGFPVVPSSNIAATPGSLGSWCGWDMFIPILTLEWMRGTPPQEAWAQTRDAILAVVRGQ